MACSSWLRVTNDGIFAYLSESSPGRSRSRKTFQIPLPYPINPIEPATDIEKPTPLFRWLFAFALLLLIWRNFPSEVAQWYVDAHRNHLLDNDAVAAFASIQKAIDWDPIDPRNWSARGGVEMELENFTASAASFDRAIELIEEFHPASRQAIAVAQNNSAYARALGQIDLERARTDIDAALRVLPPDGAWLDTRGYIRLLQGDLEGALEDTHSAVTQTESTYRARELATKSEFRDIVRRRVYKSSLRGINEELVVLYKHRAMVYEALGQTEAAERDFESSLAYQAKADRWRNARSDDE